MKTKESRFQIHDELTAPERSLPVLKGALAAGGQLSNFIAVLSGSPAALRAYALAALQRTARDAGLGLDEVALARKFESADEKEAAMLAYVQGILETEGTPPRVNHEDALEAGWSDEQLLEAVAHIAVNSFGNLVTRAGDVPLDGSAEDARLQQAA